MRHRRSLPTQARLWELFELLPNGTLVGRDPLRPVCYGGDRAHTHQYWQVRVDGGTFLLHRLIAQWFHGDIIPEDEIDHWDRNKSNNRIGNLRVTTHQGNMVAAAAFR